MGDTVGRAVFFGIPLQQQWSYRESGNDAPTYYLQSDSPLYYYSFVDAVTASEFLSLPKKEQARLDPMIIGFNPSDMYAADHVKRVLKTFPGVFEGIGEFTVHQGVCFVKARGSSPSLTDPALDRLLGFAEEAGLVVLIHNDIDTPFPKLGAKPAYLEQMRDLLARHPKPTIIWAHMGVGRVVRPIKGHLLALEGLLKDPRFKHVNFDISWEETAKYVVATPETTQAVATLMNRYPERFLFGTDEVAPKSSQEELKVYRQYDPLWKALDGSARDLIRREITNVFLMKPGKGSGRGKEKYLHLENRRTP